MALKKIQTFAVRYPARKLALTAAITVVTFSLTWFILSKVYQPVANQSPVPATAITPKIYLGAAVNSADLADPAFVKALKKYKFDSLTPETEMKCAPTEPAQDTFNFAATDKIVNFAEANHLRVRGHTLAWYRDDCTWMAQLNKTDAAKAMENHVKTLVSRYQGRIAEWDVANEAFLDDGSLRDNAWRQTLGDDYLAKVFEWAHEADPQAELYYNDFGGESSDSANGAKPAKTAAILKMVSDFKSRGVPIDGVGLQTHSSGLYPGSGDAIRQNLEQLGALGVHTEITELDVVGSTDQAQRYAEIGAACQSVDSCTGITTWGLYDGRTWQPGKDPLLLDDQYKAKPAYNALMTAIKRPLVH